MNAKPSSKKRQVAPTSPASLEPCLGEAAASPETQAPGLEGAVRLKSQALGLEGGALCHLCSTSRACLHLTLCLQSPYSREGCFTRVLCSWPREGRFTCVPCSWPIFIQRGTFRPFSPKEAAQPMSPALCPEELVSPLSGPREAMSHDSLAAAYCVCSCCFLRPRLTCVRCPFSHHSCHILFCSNSVTSGPPELHNLMSLFFPRVQCQSPDVP